MSKPIDYKKLNDVFNKYAGKELQVTEEMEFYESWPDTGIVPRLSSSDKVIAELRKAVEDMGLTLRVCDPNTVYMDTIIKPNAKRVNVFFYKGDDGKYSLGSYKVG
jgi:hypothetical protein